MNLVGSSSGDATKPILYEGFFHNLKYHGKGKAKFAGGHIYEGEFVNEHKDAQWMCLSNYWVPNTNKSSESLMVMPLNDDYEGGVFKVADKTVYPEKGSAIIFPSNFMFPHEAGVVTKGTRWSIVTWLM